MNKPDDTSKYVGFVYRIIELDTGMEYIGIKKYWKKNKKKSDWEKYNSSNKILKENIPKNPENYLKIIIKNCESVTELKAWEAYYQLHAYVTGSWNSLYNQMVNVRLRIR